MDSIGHNFHGIWRHPRARNREFKTLDLWVDLAKKAERAKVDAFFFTDVLGGSSNSQRGDTRRGITGLSNSFPEPLGILNSVLRSPPPASSSSTLTPGSADNRLASTQPTDPAPAMM